MRRHIVPVTTDASGDATAYSTWISGQIMSISYVKTDFADGVDFAITIDGTGEGLWTEENVNASTRRYPRGATHTTAGVAALYAADGLPVLDRIAIARDRVKIVVANGGNAKSGAFHIVVG